MREKPLCAVDGCERDARKRGWCDKHYKRWQAHGDPLVVLSRWDSGRYDRQGKPCAVADCSKASVTRELCRAHYLRLLKYGDPTELSDWAKGNRATPAVLARRRVPGTRFVGKAPGGYTYVAAADSQVANCRGLVLEHRLVMAQHLGRDLRPDENVHHLNGIRTDNRLENLELWVTMQPSGKRAVDLVTYARVILERYEDEVRRGLV